MSEGRGLRQARVGGTGGSGTRVKGRRQQLPTKGGEGARGKSALSARRRRQQSRGARRRRRRRWWWYIRRRQ